MLRIVLLLFFLQFSHQQQSGCLIDVSELRRPPPVVLSAYTHLPLYPEVESAEQGRNVRINAGESLLLACPGGHLGLAKGPPSALAHCNAQNKWVVNDETLSDLQGVSCDNFRTESVRNTKEKCAPNSELLEIGFDVTGIVNQFIPIVKICFDFVTRNPAYTVFNLTKSISLRTDWEENFYTDNNFYNLSIPLSQIYNDLNHMRSVVNSQVGLPENSTRYIDESGVAQSYLILPEELFYISEQDAVARDINTYPLWPGGCYNFDLMYDDIYEYIKGRKIDLEVYTGTWGIATLPHSQTGNPVEIYMYVDASTKAIPVPVLAWRLLYHRSTKRALVILSVDNDDFLDIDKYVFCPDISSSIPWLALQPCGHTLACSYYSFKDHVDILPDLDVRDILT